MSLVSGINDELSLSSVHDPAVLAHSIKSCNVFHDLVMGWESREFATTTKIRKNLSYTSDLPSTNNRLQNDLFFIFFYFDEYIIVGYCMITKGGEWCVLGFI